MGCMSSSADAGATGSKPKLVKVEYFPIYGRAESLRMLLHSQDIKYEDCPITFEDWPTKKGKGDYAKGGLPHLIVDGKRMQETTEMADSISKMCGLDAKVDAEGLEWHKSM
jgi:hypothetical protein